MESSDTNRSYNPYFVGAGVVVGAVLVVLLLSRLGGDDLEESLPDAAEYESDELAAALFADPDVAGRILVDSVAANEAITVSAESGDGALMLSTGEEALGEDDQASESDWGEAYDVTTIAVHLDLPPEATCMIVPDLKFGSDETDDIPDGFVIEIGESARSLDLPPDPLTRIFLDSSRGLLDDEVNFGGTTLKRSTPRLEAKIEIEPGDDRIFFSIYDADNTQGASIVSLGNMRFEDPPTCGDHVRLSDRSNLVALGDSYASGFGLPPFEPGTSETDGNNCQRSTKSYPEVLAELGDFELESRACQGARTKDLYDDFAERGQEPQLDGLRPDTGVVVVTVGGNDTDWIDVLSTCVVESFLGPACNDNAAANTQFDDAFDQLAGNADEPSNIRSYDEILIDIGERAPFADVVVVSYPPLFAEGVVGSSSADRCAGILKADQQWINQQLNEATGLIAEAAGAVGAVAVDLTEDFEGHGLCEPEPWFMDLSGEGPLHPNADGHVAIAESVHRVLGSSDS